MDVEISSEGIDALFVRGAGILEGEVTLARSDMYKLTDRSKWKVPEDEFGSIGNSQNRMFCEVMVRKRRLQIFQVNSRREIWCKLSDGHLSRSYRDKPEITVFIPRGVLYDNNEFKSMVEEAADTGEDQKIRVKVESNGRQARVIRIR